MAIDKRLQIKYNQVQAKFQGYFSKPGFKFYRQIVYGILKSGHIYVSRIAKSMKETISLKEVERLSRNFTRSTLCTEILAAHARENCPVYMTEMYRQSAINLFKIDETMFHGGVRVSLDLENCFKVFTFVFLQICFFKLLDILHVGKEIGRLDRSNIMGG